MPIFCVSDLHLCDRGYRDNFAVEGREARFYKFLDYVDAERGQLYVLGDLFDFWQANMSRAVVAYLDLLTRLDKMQAVYIVGNHDGDLASFIGKPSLMPGHPFFLREVRAFEQSIGGLRFAFLHGNEGDPYCRDANPGTGEVTAIISGILEDRHRGPFTANRHAIEDQFVGTLEGALTLWRHLTLQHGRMDEMLDGVEAYRKEAGADVVIYGHTHEAGHIGDYHFNAGSWARTNDTFVRIDDDGRCRLGMAAQQSAGAVSPCVAMKPLNPLEQYQAYPIPVAAIYYDAAFNCRGEFTLQSVKELADSIAQAGRLICPVAVQPWTEADGFEYRLIVGHRRFKAVTTFLNWTDIPAYVCDGLSEHEARMLNFVENLQRKSLNILEEARAIQNLYPDGAKVRQAATELKQPTKWVHVRVRLLRMPDAIQQKAAAGLLSAANLEMLAGIESADEQIMAASRIVEARQRGKGKFLPGLNKTYKRRRGVRPREEINRMVERMLAAGIGGLPPRVAAWCAGHVQDESLLKEIEAERLKLAANSDLPVGEESDGRAHCNACG